MAAKLNKDNLHEERLAVHFVWRGHHHGLMMVSEKDEPILDIENNAMMHRLLGSLRTDFRRKFVQLGITDAARFIEDDPCYMAVIRYFEEDGKKMTQSICVKSWGSYILGTDRWETISNDEFGVMLQCAHQVEADDADGDELDVEPTPKNED